jgi:hypothetical protein
MNNTHYIILLCSKTCLQRPPLGSPKMAFFRGWSLFRGWCKMLGKFIVGLLGQRIQASRCWQVFIVQSWPLAQLWLHFDCCTDGRCNPWWIWNWNGGLESDWRICSTHLEVKIWGVLNWFQNGFSVPKKKFCFIDLNL